MPGLLSDASTESSLTADADALPLPFLTSDSARMMPAVRGHSSPHEQHAEQVWSRTGLCTVDFHHHASWTSCCRCVLTRRILLLLGRCCAGAQHAWHASAPQRRVFGGKGGTQLIPRIASLCLLATFANAQSPAAGQRAFQPSCVHGIRRKCRSARHCSCCTAQGFECSGSTALVHHAVNACCSGVFRMYGA